MTEQCVKREMKKLIYTDIVMLIVGGTIVTGIVGILTVIAIGFFIVFGNIVIYTLLALPFLMVIGAITHSYLKERRQDAERICIERMGISSPMTWE